MMQFRELTTSTFDLLKSDTWLAVFANTILILVVAFIFTKVVRFVLDKVVTVFEKTETVWDEAVVIALKKPVQFLIWAFSIFIITRLFGDVMKFEGLELVELLEDIAIVMGIAWFFYELVIQLEINMLEHHKNKKSKMDPTSIGAMVKVLNITIFVFTTMAILQNLGFSVSALVAFMGGGGVVVGFAAKDFLSNFFGAIVIYLDKPFKVGDWVCSPDKSIEGTVEKISLRTTKIRAFDKRPLYVPNSVFNTIAIQNPSRMTHRRILEELALRQEDYKVAPKICADIEKMLMENDGIDKNQIMFCTVDTVNNVAVKLKLYTLTTVTKFTPFYKFKQEIMTGIMDIVHKHGAEFSDVTKSRLLPDGELS